MSDPGRINPPMPSLRVSLSLDAARRRAAALFKENQATLKYAPANDGNSLLHAITRSLGLWPHPQWTSAPLSRWTRILRSHLARYCDSPVDRDFLNGDRPLAMAHALLITRLWRIHTLIYPCDETPLGTVFPWPPVQYPYDNSWSSLVDVHLVHWSDLGQFDILEPSTIHHVPHTCAIQADDLKLFEGSEAALTLFDRFLETWLRMQLTATSPSASTSRHTFPSVAAFVRYKPIGSWYMDVRFRMLTNSVGVFACSLHDVPPDFLSRSDVSLFTPDPSVSSSGNCGSSGYPFSRWVLPRDIVTFMSCAGYINSVVILVTAGRTMLM
jgi:hypothetical protein